MTDGIAQGLRPWFTKFNAKPYDRRWLKPSALVIHMKHRIPAGKPATLRPIYSVSASYEYHRPAGTPTVFQAGSPALGSEPYTSEAAEWTYEAVE
jgi:hypothetical protein